MGNAQRAAKESPRTELKARTWSSAGPRDSLEHLPIGEPMSVRFRLMTHDDIPAGMRLKDLVGWNQTVLDWERFLSESPTGCFAAPVDDHPGTRYGPRATDGGD